MFEELEWECPVDCNKYKKIVEKERIFKFLLGLNKNLDAVRGRILGIKPLPSSKKHSLRFEGRKAGRRS